MGQSHFKILISYITVYLVQIRYAKKAANIRVKDLIVFNNKLKTTYFSDNLLLIHNLENKSWQLDVTSEYN